MNFKNIHIGEMIKVRVEEKKIEMDRICNFLQVNPEKVSEMFEEHTIDTYFLLRWSKLLEYDFFRLYTQHLILYAPQSCVLRTEDTQAITGLPVFRKNIYTHEIIEFILDLISSGAMSKQDVIQQYRIPKTTLYKWISKNEKETKTLSASNV